MSETASQPTHLNIFREVLDILTLPIDNPVKKARFLAIIQEQQIEFWKSIDMDEEYMDVDEVWCELTGLLQLSRGIRPWWDRTDTPIEKSPENEEILVGIMEVYEARYPQYLIPRKPLFASPWMDLSIEERTKLLPEFLAFKEFIEGIIPHLEGIEKVINQSDVTMSIEGFIETISDFMYEVHAIISEAMERYKKFFDLRAIQPFQLPHPHLLEHLLEYRLENETLTDRVVWLTNALLLLREKHPGLCEDTKGEDHV